MWGPLISLIAGAISDSQKAEEARRQAGADQHMSYAQRLNPHLDPALYNAMKFNRDLQDQQSQAFTRRLGDFLQSGIFSASQKTGNEELNDRLRQTDPQLLNQWDQQAAQGGMPWTIGSADRLRF